MNANDAKLIGIMEAKLQAGMQYRDAWTLSVEQLKREIQQEAEAAANTKPKTKAELKAEAEKAKQSASSEGTSGKPGAETK